VIIIYLWFEYLILNKEEGTWYFRLLEQSVREFLDDTHSVGRLTRFIGDDDPQPNTNMVICTRESEEGAAEH
jgi:(2Fe-2S) ferredoxin